MGIKFLSEYYLAFTLLAESLRSFLDKSGKRKTYLGKIEVTLLAGYLALFVVPVVTRCHFLMTKKWSSLG